MEIHAGERYISIPISTSLPYVILVNFIGGISFVYHSIKTFKPKKIISVNQDAAESSNETAIISDMPFPKWTLITGILTLLISVWFMLETFAGFGIFENGINGYGLVMIVALILYIPLFIIPGVLAARNISSLLNN